MPLPPEPSMRDRNYDRRNRRWGQCRNPKNRATQRDCRPSYMGGVGAVRATDPNSLLWGRIPAWVGPREAACSNGWRRSRRELRERRQWRRPRSFRRFGGWFLLNGPGCPAEWQLRFHARLWILGALPRHYA